MCSCRYFAVVLVAAAYAFLASSLGGLPVPLRHYFISSAFGFFGRWDRAKDETERAITTLSELNVEASAEGSSIESSWQRYFPRSESELTLLIHLAEIHFEMEHFDEAIALYLNEIIPRLQNDLGETDIEVGAALSSVAKTYRSMGEYETGLEYLAKAQTVYLANTASSKDTAERVELMQANQEDAEEMNELIDIYREQALYVSTYIDMAFSWNFARRIRADDNNCPNPNQRVWDRFYRPTCIFIFVQPMTLILIWSLFKSVWAKPTRTRCVAASFVGISLLVALFCYWGWFLDSYTGKLNSAAELYKALGKHEIALELFDEARCSILARPHEDVLFTQDTVLDTFIGPAYVYMDKGDIDVLGPLAEDIVKLIEADSGVLDPNFKILGFYFSIADKYRHLGEEAKSDHFYVLAEKASDSLSRFISEQAEEEIQKLLEPKPTKTVNESSKVALDAEREEQESGPEITVGHI